MVLLWHYRRNWLGLLATVIVYSRFLRPFEPCAEHLSVETGLPWEPILRTKIHRYTIVEHSSNAHPFSPQYVMFYTVRVLLAYLLEPGIFGQSFFSLMGHVILKTANMAVHNGASNILITVRIKANSAGCSVMKRRLSAFVTRYTCPAHALSLKVVQIKCQLRTNSFHVYQDISEQFYAVQKIHTNEKWLSTTLLVANLLVPLSAVFLQGLLRSFAVAQSNLSKSTWPVCKYGWFADK